jgi:hypothetical protein
LKEPRSRRRLVSPTFYPATDHKAQLVNRLLRVVKGVTQFTVRCRHWLAGHIRRDPPSSQAGNSTFSITRRTWSTGVDAGSLWMASVGNMTQGVRSGKGRAAGEMLNVAADLRQRRSPQGRAIADLFRTQLRRPNHGFMPNATNLARRPSCPEPSSTRACCRSADHASGNQEKKGT